MRHFVFYSKIEAYLTPSMMSSEVWRLCGLLVMWVHIQCLPVYACLLVCVPVMEHLIAAVMYPHYAPVPWPSHPAHWSSPGGTRCQGFPFSLSLLPSACPSDSILPIPQPVWSAESSGWSLTAMDRWLQFGDVNWTSLFQKYTGCIAGHVQWPHNK